MAEAPVAEASQPVAQPAPPILASFDGLDAAMASARQAASAQQAAVEAAPTTTPEPVSAPEPTAAPQPATDAPPPVADQPASAEDAQEVDGEDQETPADQQQPGKPSRMGRLREQLTQAEQAKRDIEARLQQREATDAVVRQKWGTLLGTAEEKARLDATLANPATPDTEIQQARTRLAQMRQAAEELAPLYAAVEADVFAGFTRGLEQLRTLDGMDEPSHQSLFKATSGIEALKLMHGIGKKAGEDESKGEIASLKAQVSDLKTKMAAAGAQPATPGGKASGAVSALTGLLDERGLPTEEAIARAKAGGLRQLGQTAAA